jgi:hypothetical protein
MTNIILVIGYPLSLSLSLKKIQLKKISNNKLNFIVLHSVLSICITHFHLAISSEASHAVHQYIEIYNIYLLDQIV